MDEDVPAVFHRELISAFRYPLQGDGLYVIIIGAICFAVASLASGFAGIAGLIINLIIVGYLAAYAKDVVRTSAMGDDAPPPWADFSDWMEDVLEPVLQFLFVWALAFGCLIFLEYKKPFHGIGARLAPFVAGGWGCLVFPILFLAVAMMDTVTAALNPLPLVKAIAATLPSYFLTVLFFVLTIGVSIGIEMLLSFVGWIPILPDLVGGIVNLYLLTVAIRGIGLYYRFNHEKLGWY